MRHVSLPLCPPHQTSCCPPSICRQEDPCLVIDPLRPRGRSHARIRRRQWILKRQSRARSRVAHFFGRLRLFADALPAPGDQRWKAAPSAFAPRGVLNSDVPSPVSRVAAQLSLDATGRAAAHHSIAIREDIGPIGPSGEAFCPIVSITLHRQSPGRPHAPVARTLFVSTPRGPPRPIAS